MEINIDLFELLNGEVKLVCIMGVANIYVWWKKLSLIEKLIKAGVSKGLVCCNLIWVLARNTNKLENWQI